MDDLFKFGEKANAIIDCSLNGVCPQVLKLIMLRKMAERILKLVESTNKVDGEKKMKEAEKLVEGIMNNITCDSKIAEEDDYDKYGNETAGGTV